MPKVVVVGGMQKQEVWERTKSLLGTSALDFCARFTPGQNAGRILYWRSRLHGGKLFELESRWIKNPTRRNRATYWVFPLPASLSRARQQTSGIVLVGSLSPKPAPRSPFCALFSVPTQANRRCKISERTDGCQNSSPYQHDQLSFGREGSVHTTSKHGVLVDSVSAGDPCPSEIPLLRDVFSAFATPALH